MFGLSLDNKTVHLERWLVSCVIVTRLRTASFDLLGAVGIKSLTVK